MQILWQERFHFSVGSDQHREDDMSTGSSVKPILKRVEKFIRRRLTLRKKEIISKGSILKDPKMEERGILWANTLTWNRFEGRKIQVTLLGKRVNPEIPGKLRTYMANASVSGQITIFQYYRRIADEIQNRVAD